MKSAAVSIIGRPSAGKSSLLNTICGHKVSIISPVPQTTRNMIRGIWNDPLGQLLFLDTPGYHDSERKFNRQLQHVAVRAMNDADTILYVVDSSRKPGREESAILDLLSVTSVPVVAAVNKIDLPYAVPDEAASWIHARLPAVMCIPVSAVTREGIQTLLDVLIGLAPEGEALYPEEYYTDQPPEFRIAEIIREQTIIRVSEEIPHAVFVDIADIETDEPNSKLFIRAFINVERESQKGIVVGKGGRGIRDIRKASQRELRKLFPYSIELDLRVKVQHKWRKRDDLVKKLIY